MSAGSCKVVQRHPQMSQYPAYSMREIADEVALHRLLYGQITTLRLLGRP